MSDHLSIPTDDFARLRMLDSKAAAKFCGFNEEYWRQLHRKGKTPPAVKLSERKLGWPLATLVAWQAEMASKASDKAQGSIAA
jgi:predicted DNA-binding transcriptional regulator AlpA